MKSHDRLRTDIVALVAASPGIGTNVLSRKLDLNRRDRRRLRTCLDGLVLSGELVALRGGRYRLGTGHTSEGVLAIDTRGAGIVTTDDGRRIAISRQDLAAALDGDRVVVTLHQTPAAGRRRTRHPSSIAKGRIERVVEGFHRRIIGIVRDTGGATTVIPTDTRVRGRFVIRNDDRAIVGHGVAATIVTRGEGRAVFDVRIDEDYGLVDRQRTIAAMVLAEEGIDSEFPADVMAMALREPGPSVLAGRRDLRSLVSFTIDGDEAHDFDDALSIEALDDGRWHLFVHVADVTHYVVDRSPLEREARTRGTSIYFPGGCVPMLPPEISSNLCSLLAGRDRLCLTCEMLVADDGSIVRSRIHRSVINCLARLTYSQVDECLDRGTGLPDDILESLVQLSRLTRARKIRRRERGGLDLFLPEPVPVIDDVGRLVDLRCQKALLSYQLVEECMVAANESVARLAKTHRLPILFRHHRTPSDAKTEELLPLLETFGLETADLKLSKPQGWQRLLARAADHDTGTILLPFIIRAQMRAVYAAHPSGHFGLALPLYCHFTSPIRRYPDLWTHRVLTGFLTNTSPVTISAHALESLAEGCSRTEQRADRIDREVLRRMIPPFVERFKGCRFAAIVTSVHPFGLFVQVQQPFFEGMIPIADLSDDYYRCVDGRGILVGRSTKRRFVIGDRLDVVLTRVDVATRRIDFVPVDLYDSLPFI